MKVLRPGDFDGSGVVNGDDWDAFNAAFVDPALAPLSCDIDFDGTVTGSDYDLFGQLWEECLATHPDEVRLGYAGYVRDPITGLLLARNRWYDASVGKWITRDPAGYVDGLSLYLYARGNPFGLVDPMGLRGRGGPEGPEWNHKLPKDVFLTDGKPRFEGINPNESKWGVVITRDGHRGGQHTGQPSNWDTHKDYNKHWNDWVGNRQEKGLPIDEKSVSEHLAGLMDPKSNSFNKSFSDWLSKGVKSEHSYEKWSSLKAADKVAWWDEKVASAKGLLSGAAKDARLAKSAAEGSRILERAAKGMKVLGWVGAGASLLVNAHDVYAGNKSVMEGMHDVVNPFFSAEEAREMTAYGQNAVGNFVANGRAATDRRKMDTNRGMDHDGVRGMPGDKPLGVDR